MSDFQYCFNKNFNVHTQFIAVVIMTVQINLKMIGMCSDSPQQVAPVMMKLIWYVFQTIEVGVVFSLRWYNNLKNLLTELSNTL